MDAVRQFVEVKNNSFQITLPEGFNAKRVEVIILPSDDTDSLSDDLKSLLDTRLEDYQNNPDDVMDFDELLNQLESEI
jgi:hypothetical protein